MPRCSHKTRVHRVCKNNQCNGLKVCNVHSRDCPICLEKTSSGDEVCTLVCGHAYHTCCIYPWFNTDHRCPFCRESVRRPKITVSLNFDASRVSRTVNNHIHTMISTLYDDGELPEGPIRIDRRGDVLFVVDLNNQDIASKHI